MTRVIIPTVDVATLPEVFYVALHGNVVNTEFRRVSENEYTMSPLGNYAQQERVSADTAASVYGQAMGLGRLEVYLPGFCISSPVPD